MTDATNKPLATTKMKGALACYQHPETLEWNWLGFSRTFLGAEAMLSMWPKGSAIRTATWGGTTEQETILTPQPLAVGLDREVRERLTKRIAEIDAHVARYPKSLDRNPATHADDLRSLLALAAPAEGWQGIETAPKDGARMCVAFDDCPDLPYHWEIGRFSHSKGWVNTYGHPFSGEPTHWFIPAAPTGGNT